MSAPRVVSLVPSLTELVCWLGQGESLVGRTRFCTEPAGQIEAVPVLGGTKDPDVERIITMSPDLVIANQEENRREDVEALMAAGLDVLVTDPATVAGARAVVLEVGRLVGAGTKALELAREIDRAVEERRPTRGIRVFVAVWKKPPLALGSETYGHDLVETAGATNVLASRARYPEVAREELLVLAPELILLPDEPYRFTSKHLAEFTAIAPSRLVDGKLLWWYGPRIPNAIRTLRRLFDEAASGR